MACTFETSTLPPPITPEGGKPTVQGEPAVATARIDANEIILPAPELRQRLLRLIIDREAQRKIQRSG